MFFVMSLLLSDHKVLHNIASSSSFFSFSLGFSVFFARISYFKFLEFKEFNKTIIPFAPRWLFTISYPTRVHGIIVKYSDLSVSRRSIICFSLRLRQIIDLLATEKSRYFAQPHSIIVNFPNNSRFYASRIHD